MPLKMPFAVKWGNFKHLAPRLTLTYPLVRMAKVFSELGPEC